MDFFTFFGFTQSLFEIFQDDSAKRTTKEIARLALRDTYISLGIAGGIFLLALILGGLALRTMARKAGLKPSFLMFLPFVNTYYTGKIAGEANFFGQKMKRVGLYAMIVEILYAGMETLLTTVKVLATRPEYFVQKDFSWKVDDRLLPRWQYNLFNYGQYVTLILDIFLIVLLVTLFMALFRKYYARGPVLMTILCTILPFRGFTLFAVRKNDPVDYNAYIRSRAEAYARRNNPYMYGGQGGYPGSYSGDPNVNNGQNGAPSGTGGGSAPDPFDEFGGSGNGGVPNDNPFDDFN